MDNLLPVAPRAGFEIPHGAGESVGARRQSAGRQTDTCPIMRCTSQKHTHPRDGAFGGTVRATLRPKRLNVAPEAGAYASSRPPPAGQGGVPWGMILFPVAAVGGPNIGQVRACL